MRNREIQAWQKIGAILREIGSAAQAPRVSLAERLRKWQDWLPKSSEPAGGAGVAEAPAEAVSGGAQAKVGKPEIPPASEAGPERVAPLPVPGRAVSIFAVDRTKVTAGQFFRALTFQRNDPTREPPVVFSESPARPVIETCRQFFAYSVPWTERGGVASGPTDGSALSAPTGFSSLGQLASAATAQALHLASKMKRQERLVQAYTVTDDGSGTDRATAFFSSLPWSARRLPSKQENHLGLQA